MFEAGRIAIPFLLALPAKDSGPKGAQERELVHALRTWSSHNLGFSSDRDIALLKKVQRWFVETCGANPPNDDVCWRKCCQALCAEVGAIVVHCQHAVTFVLEAPDDGESTIADLRRRIKRAWPAHEFDKLVGDAATRLGIRVDARKFREPRLPKWRSYLESLADGDDPEAQMICLVERDLLDHGERVLPLNGRDVISVLGIGPGPAVARALYHARELFLSGIKDREQLLSKLAEVSTSEEGNSGT